MEKNILEFAVRCNRIQKIKSGSSSIKKEQSLFFVTMLHFLFPILNIYENKSIQCMIINSNNK